ncbi:MAG: hypothetical protein V4736_02475, partial [Bdellovibrionota bacterium]
ATPDEVAALKTKYPLFKDSIQKAYNELSNITAEASMDAGPITKVSEIKERINISDLNQSYNLEKLQALDPRAQEALVAVYNKLMDKKGMAAYVQKLMEDSAVEMARNPDARTRQLQNFPGSPSNVPGAYTTKKEFLEKGQLDHQSLVKVLVHRFRGRGEKIGIIPKVGNYNGNVSKSQKYNDFYKVPARGGFFDKYFSAGSGHGQDVHLLQMDYVADVIFEKTGGNTELFWDYVTTRGTGDWVWDTMFDGWGSKYMSPEFTGSTMRKYIPLF